jgi:hypothetical protein
MDLETMEINNIQNPIAISSCGPTGSKLFVIDSVLVNSNLTLAVKTLWNQYFNYLISEVISLGLDKITIFAHNLGDFDGYF